MRKVSPDQKELPVPPLCPTREEMTPEGNAAAVSLESQGSQPCPAQSPQFRGARIWLLAVAIFAIVFGMRMALIARFGTSMLIADEWNFRETVETAFRNHDWRGFFERYNGQQLLLTTYLLRAVATWANGLWEPRLLSVIHSSAYSLLAVSTFLLLCRATAGRGVLAGALATLVIFAVPFAGFRATQPFCDYTTNLMLFASLTAHVIGVQRMGYWRAFAACGYVFLTTFSTGSGCLLGFSVAAILGIRAIFARRIAAPDAIVAGFGLALFAWAMISMPRVVGGSPPPMQAVKALFSGLAWPNTFFPPAALLASLPIALLGFRYLRVPAFRSRGIEALLLLSGFVVLQCAAIGVFRGENGNFGMPSGRYNDIVIFVGLLNFVALLILFRELQGHRGIRLIGLLWCGLTMAGVGIHFLWRTWPFLARENGEWYEWSKQDSARRFAETKDPSHIPELVAGSWDESSDIYDKPELIRRLVLGTDPATMLTQGSLVGINLKASAMNGFEENGYPRPYYANPYLKYWGSYTRAREAATGSFTSEPFVPDADYVMFSIIVQKKARFTSYRLDGLGLSLTDVATGRETALLPQLKAGFPSIFRDREVVRAKVEKGRQYVVKAVDATEGDWFAFSQPWEGGRLTWLTQPLLDSGKLMMLCGLLLLVAATFPMGQQKAT